MTLFSKKLKNFRQKDKKCVQNVKNKEVYSSNYKKTYKLIFLISFLLQKHTLSAEIWHNLSDKKNNPQVKILVIFLSTHFST